MKPCRKCRMRITFLLVLLSTNALVERVSHPASMPLLLSMLNNPNVNVHSHIKYTVQCSIAGTLHCILSVDSLYVIYASQKKKKPNQTTKKPLWKHNYNTISQELLCDKGVEWTFTTLMVAGNPSGFLSHKMERNFRLIWLGAKHWLQDVVYSQAPSISIELKAPVSRYSLPLSKKIPISSSEFWVSTPQLQKPKGRGVEMVLGTLVPPTFSALTSPWRKAKQPQGG